MWTHLDDTYLTPRELSKQTGICYSRVKILMKIRDPEFCKAFVWIKHPFNGRNGFEVNSVRQWREGFVEHYRVKTESSPLSRPKMGLSAFLHRAGRRLRSLQ